MLILDRGDFPRRKGDKAEGKPVTILISSDDKGSQKHTVGREFNETQSRTRQSNSETTFINGVVKISR